MIAPSLTNGVLALLAAVLALVEFLQGEGALPEERPDLLAHARLSPASARRIALRLVPGGSIRRERLEVKRRRLVFAFRIKRAGRHGLASVDVDAMTGRVFGSPVD
jgi:uncharacterized membrane protein YkoI